MTEREEIEQLRGELAAARMCIAFLFTINFSLVDEDTRIVALNKIRSANLRSGSDLNREGFERFNEKLASQLDALITSLPTEDDDSTQG